MGKKKVDVRLRVELLFDDKAPVTKDTLKAYFEDRVAGLKLKSFLSFKQDKDVTLAEVDTNFAKIFQLVDLPDLKKSPVDPADPDLADKLASNSQLLFTQLKLQKVAAGILKAAETVASQSLAVSELVRGTKTPAKPAANGAEVCRGNMLTWR